jgi:two-component system cell cycle sensor histidine kinase/response regulator CckA
MPDDIKKCDQDPASLLRLLIVEDSAEDAEMIVRELRRAGYALVYERVDTLESMRALLHWEWDLILADYKMPRFSGLDALAEFKTWKRDVPFIVVSGAIGEECAVETLKAGAQDYVLKDRLARLVPVVQRALKDAVDRREYRRVQRDRDRADEALRASEARLRVILESVQTGVMIVDPESHIILEVNSELARMVGLPPHQIVGSLCHNFVCPAVKEQCPVTDFGQLIDHSERHLLKADGTQIPVLKTVRQVAINGRRQLIESVVDISELKRLQEQVILSQKMEAIGQLAGGVAHDFNNILQVIIGYAEVIMRNSGNPEFVAEGIENVYQAAQRAAMLTRQLLVFSRRQMALPTLLGMDSVIENVRALIKHLLGEDVSLSIQCPAEFPSVYADASQLEQLILNLVVNARDAMPSGGSLTIIADEVTLTEAQAAAMPGARPGHFVYVSVADTGMGMDNEILQHVFEPFFSTKGVGHGSGLGLSVAYGIAKQHEGWVTVESQVGKGSTFTFYLPVREGDKLMSSVDAPINVTGKGERILLIEDEPEVRVLASRVLLAAGYEVVAVGTFADGDAALRQDGSSFDLVFSDVVLPDGNGVELVERALERNPKVGVLITSGYTDERSRWQTIQDRGFPFLPKPHSPSRLLNVIREVLASVKVA